MTDAASDLRFHAEALRDYLLCWESADIRLRRGMSEEEAAYHLLEHAGWLDRYGAASTWVDELRSLPAEDRRRLIGAASGYAGGMTWAERARRLLAAEALSPEELEAVEDLLIRRDALETVWSAARMLAADLLATDAETGRSLAWTRSLAAEIDDELAQRPDVVSVAARVLNALPPPLTVPAELSAGWWYAGVRDLGAAYQRPVLPPRRSVPAPAPTPLLFVADPEYALAAARQGEEETYRLVAASGERLLLRVFPRDASGQLYTLAIDPVSASQEVTLYIDDERIESVRPPEYVVAQQLVYLTVTADVYRRLTVPTARRWAELRERDGPG
jgi:hypothetical protein